MKAELPVFKYHPNLYDLGIVEFEKGICNCCGKETNAYIQKIKGRILFILLVYIFFMIAEQLFPSCKIKTFF